MAQVNRWHWARVQPVSLDQFVGVVNDRMRQLDQVLNDGVVYDDKNPITITGRFNINPGPLVVGVDPGGADIVRVGGNVQLTGAVIISAAATNPDRSIRRNTDNGLIRLMGGNSASNSGQLRVFGTSFGSAFAVDCWTPNAAAVETFRWGIAGGVDWPSFVFQAVSQVHIGQSGKSTQFQSGVVVAHGVTSADDAATMITGYIVDCTMTATDGTGPFDVKHVGYYSNATYGVAGGAAAIGSVWNYGAVMVVNNSGSSSNELASYFGVIRAQSGSNFRAWFTDYTVLGPTTGVQMNLAGGVTMLINNYFNGTMAANGTVACFNAVTRPSKGSGGNSGEFAGKTTYAIDAGFQVCGWAGLTIGKTVGFTTAFLAGGTGGMWNAAKDNTGTPDANSLSIIGTAFEGRDVTTYGVNLHHPNLAAAVAYAVSQGTWDIGLDLSGGAFNTSAIKTAGGKIQLGDRTGVGVSVGTGAVFQVQNGLSVALAGTVQRGILVDFASTSAATVASRGLEVRAQSAAAAYTVADLQGIYINPPVIGATSTATNVYGLYIDNQAGGGTNYSIYTNGGQHRLGGTVNITTGALQMAGTQVVTTRRTGWTAWTGTATRTSFATGTATLVNVAEAVKALIDDLITHGLIGA